MTPFGQRLLRKLRARLASRRAQKADVGDTLIELLVALAVLGIVVVAVLSGFMTSITTSLFYRTAATTDTALRTTAEEATSLWQQNSAVAFTCPNNTPGTSWTTGNAPYSATFSSGIPAGYTAQVVNVSYWNGGAFNSGCAALQPQQITVQVAHGGVHHNISFVVQDPAAPARGGVVGPPTQLVFLPGGGPSDSTSGSAIPDQPQVAIENAAGNPATGDLSAITLSISSGPSGATLSNCVGQESYGVVNFSGCEIDQVGTFTLTATNGALTSSPSGSFVVSAGPPAQLIFTTSPGNTVAGNPLSSQPVITIEDAAGNPVTTDSSQMTLGITAGTGSAGATLNNCPQSEAQGVVSFSQCEIDQAGTGYTLTATDGSLTAISSSFNVASGKATHLGFTTSPGISSAGAALAPQPVVTVEDAFNNPATGDSSKVALTIKAGTGSSGAVLSGCSPVESLGVVNFSGCKINKIGNGYALTATDGTLTSATSATFNIAVGPPAQLVFTASPSNTVAGNALTSQPVITIEDAAGDPVTNDSSKVVLGITPGTGSPGATMKNCSPSESLGVVSFSHCEIDQAGTGYTLTATDGLLTSATSTAFNIAAGAPAQLVFTTPPRNSTAGAVLAPQPVVTVEDAFNNPVTTDSSKVTLGITPGTGSPGATMKNCSPSESLGVVSFSHCEIDQAGTSYTLTASDGTLTSATSTAFNIAAGAPTRLVFTTSPGNSTAGAVLAPQPVVTVEDAFNNPVTTDSSKVTLTGAVLSGCSTSESLGVVSFSGCKINKVGGGYVLTATDGSLTSATSASFNIVAGAPTQLVFTTSPGNTSTHGNLLIPQPILTVEDANGNVVTSDRSLVTIGITPHTGSKSATLSGCSQIESQGVISFSGCTISNSGSNYSLTAIDGSLTSVSGSFNVG